MPATTTRIYVSKDRDEATEWGAGWVRLNEGYEVATIGPTDAVVITGDAGPKIDWNSGDAGDWYIVIATKDEHQNWIDSLPDVAAPSK